LSVLNVSVDTLRLLDAYTIFYSAYLQPSTKKTYLDIIKSAQASISQRGKEELKVKVIKQNIAAKVGTLTKEGKERKARITEKIFTNRPQTLLILHFYTAVLPFLEKYVGFFQSKEPRIHELHTEQETLLKDFLLCFIRPDDLPGKGSSFKSFNAENTAFHLPSSLRFYGCKTRQFLCEMKKNDSIRSNFEQKAVSAYVAAAKVLIAKMPLNNAALQAFSAFDPTVRKSTACLRHLLKLPSLMPALITSDDDSFDLEVRRYQGDSTLPSPDVPISKWWSAVDPTSYPLLTKAAKVALTCFHGPIVESTFSIIGLIVNKHNTQLDMETYSAFQTVKYALLAAGDSAIRHFSKGDPLKDPVNKELTRNLRQAWKMNEERKDNKKAQREKDDKDRGMAAVKVTKRKANEQLKAAAKRQRPNSCIKTPSTSSVSSETSSTPSIKSPAPSKKSSSAAAPLETSPTPVPSAIAASPKTSSATQSVTQHSQNLK